LTARGPVPIWSFSAIFVVEDDSRDRADHIDAHRTEAAVIQDR
jgi:hypothetical protein